MSRPRLSVLAAACALSGLAPLTRAAGEPPAPPPASEGPGLASAAFRAGVPAALEVKRAPTGHVLVRCRINGLDAGWFIFDTGAGICVVSTPMVERLGLRDAGEIDAVGVGGEERAGLVEADSLEIGPLTLSGHAMLVTDLSFLKPHLGEEIAGVIGYGVLSHCVAELDLTAPAVSIHPPDAARLEGLAWSELVLLERAPAVRAQFEGGEGLFRLDTGADGHVTFHEPAVRRLGLLEGREVGDGKLGGVGGFVASKRGRLGWFELGGVRTEDVPADFAVEAKGSFAAADREGNIGVGLLRPFVLFLDYERGRIAFVPREAGAP